MQTYWGNPENKNFIMTLMVEEREGFPPPLTPESPPGSRVLDYEERLGIPLPIALVGEGVRIPRIPATQSMGRLPLSPRECCHPIHRIAATQST